MIVIGVDPGPEQTAIVVWDATHGKCKEKYLLENAGAIVELWMLAEKYSAPVAIEMIASYGMAVGREVFETCVWIGRFMHCCETHGIQVTRVYRKDVKLSLCGTTKANDSNIRQALVDRHGDKGTKKNPGPLFGFKKDLYAALAVATFEADRLRAL